MEDELKEIAMKMNEFSNKYNCKIEMEVYESKYIDTNKTYIVYKLTAIKPEQILTKIII